MLSGPWSVEEMNAFFVPTERVFILTTTRTFSLPLASSVSFLLSLWSSVPAPNDLVFFCKDVTTNKEAAKQHFSRATGFIKEGVANHVNTLGALYTIATS